MVEGPQFVSVIVKKEKESEEDEEESKKKICSAFILFLWVKLLFVVTCIPDKKWIAFKKILERAI